MAKPSKYFIEERILIDADIDTVWKYMTDWDSYPKWNPFIIKIVKIDQKDHELMQFTLKWSNGKKGQSLEQLVSANPPNNGVAELKYKYASFLAKSGLLRATRTQRIERKGSQTSYYTREEFFGILACFVPFVEVKKGFAAQALALREVASP